VNIEVLKNLEPTFAIQAPAQPFIIYRDTLRKLHNQSLKEKRYHIVTALCSTQSPTSPLQRLRYANCDEGESGIMYAYLGSTLSAIYTTLVSRFECSTEKPEI
jgi:hypothetical protein